jgi:uncharacterized coiled-coil DUF342 family protein
MAPEKAELIEKIEEERERIREVLDAADESLKQADQTSERISRDLDQSDAVTEQALMILRRAGLLHA